MFEAIIHEPTFGEKLVHARLSKLPKKEFFFQYEPQINTANGKQSKPDFIIVSARLGVLVVEVKDWVQLSGGDQENVDVIQSDGTPRTFPNPIRIAERYAYDLNSRFESRAELWEMHRKKKRLKFPWQVMVVLPNISHQTIARFEEKGIWPRNVVVGRNALKDHETLERALRDLPWRFKLEEPLSLDMLDLIREIVNPQLVVEDAEGNPVGTLSRVQEKLINDPVRILTPGQLALPEEDETQPAEPIEPEVRLLRGVAGSGKTLVLVQRARRLIEQYPESKSLVLTFNVEIAKDLKKRIGLPDDAIEVTNFHKLCYRVLEPIWHEPIKKKDWLRQQVSQDLADLGLPIDFVADELAWRVERNLRRDADYLDADRKGRGYPLDRPKREVINRIFNKYQAYKQTQRKHGAWFDWDDVAFLTADALQNHPLRESFHTILIDEAQDFTPSWMQVVKLLLKPGGQLFICDDPSQSIFHAYSWAQKAVQVVGRSVILRVPYRSTREISLAAHSLIEADENLKQTEERPEPDFSSYELGSGLPPELLEYQDERLEILQVTQAIHRLLDEGMPGKQIAILCQTKAQMKRWTHLEGLDIYVNFFEKMKGLEFNAVFIPHLHEMFQASDDSEIISAKRRKLFTAMTRARYGLTLTYVGLLPAPLTPLLTHVRGTSLEQA